MAREKFEEIVAYYKTYTSIIQPLLKETKLSILELEAEQLLEDGVLQAILQKEIKRKVHKVKAIAEFNAFFRSEIFNYIIKYIEESKEELEKEDIRDYILDYLDEAIKTFEVLINLVNDDQRLQSDSLLFKLTNLLNQILLPKNGTIEEVYSQLIEQSPQWYEAQRYILRPTTFYRETIGEMIVPGLSPKTFQIINNITSLFNLDPNFVDMPENPRHVIPAIMISDIFEPYIDKIANAEEEAIKRICQRMGLRIMDGIFIAPTEEFLELEES